MTRRRRAIRIIVLVLFVIVAAWRLRTMDDRLRHADCSRGIVAACSR